MSMFPNKQDVRDIATELRTSAVFLEKDYHVSRIIKALSEFKDVKFEPIFCGGTSLLKAYKLINRFSEDIDFRIINRCSEQIGRSERKKYREKLLNDLDRLNDVEVLYDTLISRDNSRFFSVMLNYPKRFGEHVSIRSEVKLDGTFVQSPLLGLAPMQITPIIGDYMKTGVSCSIRCISLRETTADKCSALVWRVLNRIRNHKEDDKTIIRHLYDLCTLINHFENDLETILEEACRKYEIDHKRGSAAPENYGEALTQVLQILISDSQYREEYEQFVLSMCFGASSPPSYNDAIDVIKKFESLIK